MDRPISARRTMTNPLTHRPDRHPGQGLRPSVQRTSAARVGQVVARPYGMEMDIQRWLHDPQWLPVIPLASGDRRHDVRKSRVNGVRIRASWRSSHTFTCLARDLADLLAEVTGGGRSIGL